MTNHVHLLLERQASAVGRIMHRRLTGYAQYYNGRYRRVGHLLQGLSEIIGISPSALSRQHDGARRKLAAEIIHPYLSGA
jgi:hypothetical protein